MILFIIMNSHCFTIVIALFSHYHSGLISILAYNDLFINFIKNERKTPIAYSINSFQSWSAKQ